MQRSASDDAAEENDPLPQELSSYKLLGVLGQGGMGVVYKARHKQLDRLVAIKVLNPRLTSAIDARRRFEREIRILGNLHHPGIVMATDAGRIGQAAYLVMELVEGVDLARLVRRTGPLSIGEACAAARQMAEALAAAHQANTIHRDVKPSNAMLDANGRVKLLDFGLANLATLAVEDRETSLGRLLGTLDYMAPEQAAAREDIDQRADVYSLGATLFYLLTGRPPHGAKSDRSLLDQLRSIAEDEPPRVSSARADVPPELDVLIAKMLSRDCEQRPNSAAEVAEQLGPWAAEDLRGIVSAEDVQPDEDATSGSSKAERSLARLLGTEGVTSSQLAAEKPSKVAPATATKPPSIGGRMALVVAAALAVAVVYAGLVFLLQTPEGVVRIETEVDGVNVQLVDEKDAVHELTIENEAEETVLRAGRYRVRLAGAHDGLLVEPQVITLRKGETEIARITRSEKPAAPALAGRDTEEPLYQGEPERVWRQRFAAEQDPIAKLAAAQALIVLSASRDPNAHLEATIEIGGELAEAGWGDDHLLLPAHLLGKSNQIGPSATRWQASEELENAWIEFYKSLGSQLRLAPPQLLAERLGEAVAADNGPKSSFAAWALAVNAVTQTIRSDPTATEIALQKLDLEIETIDIAAVAAILRIRLFEGSENGRLRDILETATTLAERLIAAPSSPVRDRLDDAWLSHTRDLALEPRLAAQLVLRELIALPLVSLEEHFRQRWFNKNYPYSSGAYYPHLRDQAKAWLPAWIDVANEYLQSRAGDATDWDIAAVIYSLDYVLRVRSPDDDWDVQTTAKLLTERLRRHYDNAEGASYVSPPATYLSVTPALLLAQILRCGGEIPDFVREGPPSDPKVREKLAEFERLLTSDVDRTQFFREVDKIRGVFDEAPHQTFRLILTEKDFGETAPSAREVIDSVKSQGANLVDPLILLAVSTELAGESDFIDANLWALLDSRSRNLNGHLRRHIDDMLDGPTVLRGIAHNYLQQIVDKTSQTTLQGAVRMLDPTVQIDGEEQPVLGPRRPD